MGSTTVDVFGNDKTDAVAYLITDVDPDSIIEPEKLKALTDLVAYEYKRRKGVELSLPTPSENILPVTDATVIIDLLNYLKDKLEVTPTTLGTTNFLDRYGFQTRASRTYNNGTGQGDGGDGTATAGTYSFTQASSYTQWFDGVQQYEKIRAQHVNDLILKLNGAGGVCICNCNYCTCNCNYCTCNCNYSCTCNCNYSDERLKDEIKMFEETLCQ